ncbi:hypothetical protein FHP05_14770 [Cerasibacillus terrae]|uniref:Uncharacterized protein n=1 Tax=Cerasibacillus terrae TaxID=2498845 RepID=A0A5C8NE37_9BACI|nr:hypothetical protein [Cerasibacillus terrae]TXL57867.1 hypothetical protein FHP05_14770 [Cerasibacillus terrae]
MAEEGTKLSYKRERISDMRKKRLYVIIGFLLVVTIIGVGGKMYMDKQNRNDINIDKKVEQKIAKEFATNYIAPNDKEISEIAFYKEPVDQKDFSGNRNYFFYFNGNKQWTVGVSVEKETGEIWAFGSDVIQLSHKEKPKEVKNLTIKHWRDNSDN